VLNYAEERSWEGRWRVVANIAGRCDLQRTRAYRITGSNQKRRWIKGRKEKWILNGEKVF
jgi:hypothetical protein